MKIYQQLLTSTDEVTRAYAQRWIEKLTSGGAGKPPSQPPQTSVGNGCPPNWNRNAVIEDGRHRLQALRTLYGRFGDFGVPVTVLKSNLTSGKMEPVDCEVPVSELLKIRVNHGGVDMAGRSATNNWQNKTPEQVRQEIQKHPDLRIRVNRY